MTTIRIRRLPRSFGGRTACIRPGNVSGGTVETLRTRIRLLGPLCGGQALRRAPALRVSVAVLIEVGVQEHHVSDVA